MPESRRAGRGAGGQDSAQRGGGGPHAFAHFALRHGLADTLKMLSFVDACLGRLPGPAAPCRPLLRLLKPLPSNGMQRGALLQSYAAASSRSSAAVPTPRHATPAAASAEDFYSGSTVTFGTLGLSNEICSALQHAGFTRPSQAQVCRPPPPPERLLICRHAD